jgi:hypothetical protein
MHAGFLGGTNCKNITRFTGGERVYFRFQKYSDHLFSLIFQSIKLIWAKVNHAVAQALLNTKPSNQKRYQYTTKKGDN